LVEEATGNESKGQPRNRFVRESIGCFFRSVSRYRGSCDWWVPWRHTSTSFVFKGGCMHNLWLHNKLSRLS